VKGPGHGLGKSIMRRRQVLAPAGEGTDIKAIIREKAGRVEKAVPSATPPTKTDLD
jgi:hypothetical protein